jgi:cobalt-zinc-cadmium resistance protein CzcA
MLMSLLVLRVLYSVFAGVTGDTMVVDESSENELINNGQVPGSRSRESAVSSSD